MTTTTDSRTVRVCACDHDETEHAPTSRSSCRGRDADGYDCECESFIEGAHGWADMECHRCGLTFQGEPMKLHGYESPYDDLGRVWCGECGIPARLVR